MNLELRETSGPLPTSVFDLKVGEKIVGFIQIRHQLSRGQDVPIECASHIYYEINQAERRKGYGTKILELGKLEAKKIGLREVIITCLVNNLASKKIIETNGGKLIGNCQTGSGQKILKYLIKQ